MTDNMVLMWKDLMSTLFSCFDEKLLEYIFIDGFVSPESFIEHMLFEFCKYTYYEIVPKYPLRHFLQYDSMDNSERMVYSRTMDYAQKFKDKNYELLKEKGDDPKEYAELKRKPMNTIADRKDGYELSEMDLFETKTIHDLELVKTIAENRIYSSKKISNQRFKEIFSDYDIWVQELIERSKKSDEDMVFSTIAFFTFEWKYAIEYYYHLSQFLIENNIESIEFFSTWLFTGTFEFESRFIKTVSADSRFIKDRIELIPIFFDADCNPTVLEIYKSKYIELLTIKTLFFKLTSTEGGLYVDWFKDNVSMADIASFFRDYNVFQIWQQKSFDNKMIKTLRYVLEVSSTFNKNM